MLSREEREHMAFLLAEQRLRYDQRKFSRMFPDEDTEQSDGSVIHAREKYERHLEFFEAGATYRERCFMAANRCITPWTWLETPGGLVPSAEAWISADARVLAWADGLECAAPLRGGFLKGIEPAFRLVTGSGRFFDCSRRHQVLTVEGWLSLDQIVSRASGLRSWHRRSDYQASCAADGYLGDEPLRSVAGIDLSRPPSPDGARQRAPLIFEMPDEAARTLRHIRACPSRGRLSSHDDLRRLAGLFSLFAGASSAQSDLSLSGRTRGVLPLVQELGARLQSGAGLPLDLCEAGDRRAFDLTLCRAGSCTPTESDATRRSGARWCDVQLPGGSVREWSRDELHIAIFYPWEHVLLVGGETIAAIVPIGLQPIIDAQVPDYNNYKSGGVYHHNSGKTVSGAYEATTHLTGLYPQWWIGRRFDHPIRAWAAGKTNETSRDIVQTELLGSVTPPAKGRAKGFSGTGMIPGRLLGPVTWKQGVQDFADTIKVKHVSGGYSTLGMKSFQQGRGSFEGTAQHLIWLDEECPIDVYGECLIRTATTKGVLILTFTPLEGLTETVLQFMPQDMRPE